MIGSDGTLSIVLDATLDAPRVVAKGKGSVGAKVTRPAKAHDIPIEENVLMGAISHVEIGAEIPAELTRPSRKC